MLPVALDEDGGLSSSPSSDPPRVAADDPTSRRRLLRWWPVAAVAAVALMGGQAVLDQRERAALDRLRNLPGVLLPLDASMRELWRTDDLSGIPSAGVGSDFAIGAMRPDGSQVVRLVDGPTGGVRWELPVTGAETALPEERSWNGPYCASATDGLLACRVADQYEVGSDATSLLQPTEPDTPVPTRSRLVVIDSSARRVVAEHPTSFREPATVTSDLFVVGDAAQDQSIVLEAADLRTGEVRWRRTLAAAPAEDGEVDITPAAPDANVMSTWLSALPDGRLLVHHHQTDWVLSSSGDVLQEVASTQQGSALQHVRGSTFLITPWNGVGRASLLLPDGSRTQTSGWPLGLSVDDGSAPGQCFLTDGGLLVVNCATGAQLWDTEVAQPSGGILLDGILYLSSGAWVVALDTHQHRTLWTWEREGRGVAWDGLFTDGRDLYVLDWRADADAPAFDRNSTGSFRVVTLSTEDGSELWAAPLDVRAQSDDVWAMALAGRLLVREMSATGTMPIRVFGSG